MRDNRPTVRAHANFKLRKRKYCLRALGHWSLKRRHTSTAFVFVFVCVGGGVGWVCVWGGVPRGPLVFEVGYQPRKKIHVIRGLGLFFRTRQCTRIHRLGVQKREKLEKKGVFLVMLTNFRKDMTVRLRKAHAKTHI